VRWENAFWIVAALIAGGMVVYALYLSALALTDLICGREEK